jgi:hypothetical protein
MAVAVKTTLQGHHTPGRSPTPTPIILSIWEGDYTGCVYLSLIPGYLVDVIPPTYLKQDLRWKMSF